MSGEPTTPPATAIRRSRRRNPQNESSNIDETSSSVVSEEIEILTHSGAHFSSNIAAMIRQILCSSGVSGARINTFRSPFQLQYRNPKCGSDWIPQTLCQLFSSDRDPDTFRSPFQLQYRNPKCGSDWIPHTLCQLFSSDRDPDTFRSPFQLQYRRYDTANPCLSGLTGARYQHSFEWSN
ncbi:hypothetical protein MAP00_002474 [Monascus purpureus]|nr:hypothetical protein MAP00_002474 [Monascus purpureus]